MFVRLLLAALLCLPLRAETLRAYTEDFPPYNMLDEQARPTGFAVELLDLLMQEARRDYQLELVPWARALGLTREVPDTLIFTIARTPERESFFHWVGPFAARSTALMRLRDAPFKVATLSEAKAYRVGVVNGDAGMELLRSEGFVRGQNLIPVDKRVDLIRLLQAGSLDYIVASPTIIRYVASRAGLGPEHIQVEQTLVRQPDGFYFALNRQSSPQLVQALQAAFARLQERGALAPLKRKYQIE